MRRNVVTPEPPPADPVFRIPAPTAVGRDQRLAWRSRVCPDVPVRDLHFALNTRATETHVMVAVGAIGISGAPAAAPDRQNVLRSSPPCWSPSAAATMLPVSRRAVRMKLALGPTGAVFDRPVLVTKGL